MPRKKLTEIIDDFVEAHRNYQEVKEEAIGRSVNKVESGTNPFLFAAFFLFTIILWMAALNGNQELILLAYNHGPYYLVLLAFATSYFTFFLGSKFIFRPTVEEIEDDTSVFALFSACPRKERRGLISVGLGILHTLILVVVVVSQDWPEVFVQ